MLSFAAENAARVRAMLAARENVNDKLVELTQRYRVVRQDEITSEIVELTAGATQAGLIQPARHDEQLTSSEPAQSGGSAA